MRRLSFFISIALAMLAFAIPALASAQRHHKRHHHARVADRNHNGMPDRWEHRFRVHKAKGDPDRDGVANLGEFHNGTNPRDADTDNDGVEDGNDDANHDGIDDENEQSGVIDSFDGTTLTVTLVNGDTLKGIVNDNTEIECESTAPTTTASTRHDGGDDNENESGDDNSGSGSSGSGDDDATEHSGGDNSGPGSTTSGSGDDEQGDDNGDDNGENEGNCGKDALTAHTIVKEAELRLTSGGAVFHEIELGGKAPA